MMTDRKKFLLKVLMTRRSQIIAYLWSIVRDRHAAEDLFQTVSLITLDKSPEIESETEVFRWVLRTARYEALHLLRDRKKETQLFEGSISDLIDDEWVKVTMDGDKDSTDALTKCIDRLSPRARKIIDLKYNEGLSGAAIAEKLGSKINAVYVSISRIHKVLFECIKQQSG